MPNIKSQKDRVLQTAKETLRNKSIKTDLRTALKKADAAVATGAADKDAQVIASIKKIDKAVAKGVMHKNAGARKVSQMMKKAK